MERSIYFDHAAATPVHKQVLAAMTPYFTDVFYNPSATYTAAQSVKKELERARGEVAHILGARPSEIVFTAGGTEANNLAIKGVMEQFPDATMIVGAIEHESVLEPAKRYGHKILPANKDGMYEVNALKDLIDEKTVLISVMYANNEVGTIQPLRTLTTYIKEVKMQRRKAGNTLPLYVHTDACQAGNYLDLHVARLGVDMMTLNGGKIYGPKQSGALYIESHVRLQPLIEGGGQERGVRSGTENVAYAVGFAEALRMVQAKRKTNGEAAQALQDFFIKQLISTVPEIIINGSQKHRLANNVHITLSGQDNERLIFALDERGIMAAAGSACTASSETPSHVLQAMGISAQDARSSLRFTLGSSGTTKDDIIYTVQTLADILV